MDIFKFPLKMSPSKKLMKIFDSNEKLTFEEVMKKWCHDLPLFYHKIDTRQNFSDEDIFMKIITDNIDDDEVMDFYLSLTNVESRPKYIEWWLDLSPDCISQEKLESYRNAFLRVYSTQ